MEPSALSRIRNKINTREINLEARGTHLLQRWPSSEEAARTSKEVEVESEIEIFLVAADR